MTETFDQQQVIAEFTRLMEAGPDTEQESALRVVIAQAYAHNMYFDYDRGANKYILVGPLSGMRGAARQALLEDLAQIAQELGQVHDKIKALAKIFPGLAGISSYRYARSRVLSAFVLFSEEVPDSIAHATDEDLSKEVSE